MDLEEKDVNEESQTSSDSSTEEQEQTSDSSEDVSTHDVDSEKLAETAENYKLALKKERERRKQLEAQLKTSNITKQQAPEQDDEIAQRFYQAEANAFIARKMAEDPTFKDRVDLVIKEMEENPSLTALEADSQVKVRIFDQMVNLSDDEVIKKPTLKNVKPTATPEPKTQSSNVSLKDVRDGTADFDDAQYLRVALKKFKA